MIIRGRNRDTAWFSIIDEEWPALKAVYERWLAPENFDGEGRQRTRLSELTAAALAGARPFDDGARRRELRRVATLDVDG